MLRCVWLAAAVALGVTHAALADEPVAPSVRCLLTGEGSAAGRLLAIEDGELILARNARRESLPLTALREIVLTDPSPPAVPPPWTAWANDGSRFVLRAIEGGDESETVRLVGYGWQGSGVPLNLLRAAASRSVMLGPADRLEDFQEARDDPPVGEDLLMLAKDDRRHLISCAVEQMTDSGVAISVGEARRTVPWGSVRWLVLASGDPALKETPGHLAELRDGTRIRMASLTLRDGTLRGRSGPAGYSVTARQLAGIRIGSQAYCYLSDVEPERVSVQAFVDVVWPPQFDLAVMGGPLSLDGTTYPKGIGMHTRTEMAFQLGGRYSRFYAMVGVDDAAGKLGAVVFKVLTDGQPIYEGEPLGGGDPPRSLALDIAGAERLTLVAEFGSPVVAGGNFADWAEARVVK